jgi:MFS family permease
VTSFLLASAISQPFISSLSDIFGRRELLMSALLLFTAGTTLAALSQNFTQLLAGRSVQGIGGGGIMALVEVIFTDVVPLRQRSKYISLVQIAWAFGTVAGPLVGGAIAEKASWRWIFYVRLPLLAAGLVMTMLFVRLDSKRRSWWQKLRKVDWLGGAMFIPSITSFLVAVIWGGTQYPWGSWKTAVPLTVGALGIGATLLWEKWGASEPFFKSLVFSQRSSSAAFGCAFVQGAVVSRTSCHH